MRLPLRLLTLLLTLVAWGASGPAWSQTSCASPGRDGSTFSANPNTYYPGVGTATAGTRTLSVGNQRAGGGTTSIAVGDLLLVIQMQGADISTNNNDSYGDGVAGGAANGNLATNFTAGQYEYVTVSAIASGTITTVANLVNTYVTSSTATANSTVALRTFQVVRIPQYLNLVLGSDLVPPVWNGSTGGIIALDVAGTLNFNGKTIDVSGTGFRGGAGRVLTTTNVGDASYFTADAANLNAQKGEGTAGTPRYVNTGNPSTADTGINGYPSGSSGRGGPGNAGGGGNDNTNNTGGGGGANGGAAGRGGNSFTDNLVLGGEPGAAFAIASATRLVLGGGGGAGTTNDGTGTPGNGFASSGSAGGGIVLLRTGAVSNSGSILANGAATNSTVLNDGGGGGGAGGSILLTATTPAGLSNLTLAANGANGASNNPGANGGKAHGPGGGGGGGIVLANGPVGTLSTAGGAAGICTSVNGTSTFGAAAGSSGQANSTSISSTIANTTAGASCIGRLTVACASPGRDGSTFSANPNTYYPGVGTATAGTRTLSVGNQRAGGGTTSIAVGDLLLVIQMQGADISTNNNDSYGDGVAGGAANGNLATNFTAGQYEYVTVSAIASGTITTVANLVNTYTTATASSTAALRTFQVVRIPQYSALTLTGNISPPAWNGSTGGIIALDVQGQLDFGNFKIDASALGFRGGAGILQSYNSSNPNTDYLTAAPTNAATATQANGLNAQKGEGTAGSPRYANVKNATTFVDTGVDNYPGGSSGRGAPGNAGGGGNDNGNNTGGGGGANGGTGGRGGNSAGPGDQIGGEPGASFTVANANRLTMGGGGGAGTTNDGTGTGGKGFASSGAPGGGLVIVRANAVSGTVNGTGGISVDGGTADNSVVNDGGGGGGAGGTILLTAATNQAALANLTMSALGGTGGNTNPGAAGGSAHGPGGGGGGGVVLTSGATKTTTAVSTAGGTNGNSSPGGAYGAAGGTSGSSLSSTSTSTTIAYTSAGATCSVNPLPVVLTSFTAKAVNDHDAQLSWSTASELNSAYFEVERSLDGTSFSKVSQLAAKGTTNSASTYTFIDKGVASLAAGPVYYRLKQVDQDATFSYSPVRPLSFGQAAATLSLYPNPAQQTTSLDLSQLPATATYRVLLLDAMGRTLSQLSLRGGQVPSLDLSKLASGTYFVRVTGTRADGSPLRQTLLLAKE